MRYSHCPNCDGEVVVWDSDLEADKCLDCGESWTLEEQELAGTAPIAIGWWWYAERQPDYDDATEQKHEQEETE